MSKMTTNQIRELARKIVGSRSGGIRYPELVQDIAGQSPETPVNTIHGAIWDLATRFPTEIIKPSRGLFQPASAPTTAPTPITIVDQQEVEAGGAEIDFYGPFAEWLKNDLDEVTVVSSLGGAGLKTKWGTPDVVGVYKPTASNLIKFPLEIVSAEIKISPQAPVVAFGQAVAYRLFSTKSYVVMPSSLSEEDASRLESLCMLFGIGMVIFNPDREKPEFTIRVRAQRYIPDMFYVNEFAERLRQHNSEVFERLFA